MMELATFLGIVVVGLGAVIALWDGFRRALDGQVEMARLRVEGMRQHELDALAQQIAATTARVGEVERAYALGRRK